MKNLKGFAILVILAAAALLLWVFAPVVLADEAGAIGPLLGDTGVIALVGLLAVVAEGLVEGLVAPLFDKWQLDKFWLTYAAWAVVSILVGLSGANLFVGIFPPLVGVILTALIAGRGANWIHDVFSRAAKSKEAIALQLAEHKEYNRRQQEAADAYKVWLEEEAKLSEEAEAGDPYGAANDELAF